MKKVLMATSVPYNAPYQVGSHHYARAFKKLGYEVLVVSVPVSPLHYLKRSDALISQRCRSHSNGVQRQDGIYYYVPFSFLAPNRFPVMSTRFVFENWHRFSSPNVLDVIREQGFGDVECLWFDSPIFGFLTEEIDYGKCILRLADDATTLPGLAPYHLSAELAIARNADVIVYVAKLIRESYCAVGADKNWLFVPNGLDLELLSGADSSFPDEYIDIPGPRLVFVGAINYRFDEALMCAVADALPDASIVLIGQDLLGLSDLLRRDNVFNLGVQAYHRLGQFLTHANVGIIPYCDIPSVQPIRPLKLFDYLFFNLPVVTSSWDGMSEFSELAYVSETYDAFISNIRLALDSPKTKVSRDVFDGYSWDAKLNAILSAL